MTTMSSMKFRTENDMSLSSTTQGLENHENPLGSPKAEDGSSRPRCRGPQEHRLKPVKTKPAYKAVLIGQPNVTKCIYLMMICTFSALMIYGGKEKISQHRRLAPKNYKKIWHIDYMMGKLTGKFENKRIVGENRFDKKNEIANVLLEKLTTKWGGNVEKLEKNAGKIFVGHKENINNETEEDFLNRIKPMYHAIRILTFLIQNAREERNNQLDGNDLHDRKINCDEELMDFILERWLTTSDHTVSLGENATICAKTLEIVNNFLLAQYEQLDAGPARILALFKRLRIKNDSSTGKFRAVRISMQKMRTFTGEFYLSEGVVAWFQETSGMPDLQKPLAESMNNLSEAVNEALCNRDFSKIKAFRNNLAAIKHSDGPKSGQVVIDETPAEFWKFVQKEETGEALERAIEKVDESLKTRAEFENMLVFLKGYCGSTSKPSIVVYNRNIIKGKTLEGNNMRLGLRAYIYDNKALTCQRPKPHTRFSDYCKETDGKRLIEAWGLAVSCYALKNGLVKKINYPCDPRDGELIGYWSHEDREDKNIELLEKFREAHEKEMYPGVSPPEKEGPTCTAGAPEGKKLSPPPLLSSSSDKTPPACQDDEKDGR